MDDYIPFNEWFIIPYMFWFVYLIGMLSYTFFKNKPYFVRLMKYIMVTNTLALLIFTLYPTCQNLRPLVLPRNNVLTRFIWRFYQFDTNTNVAPSLHVIDSVAVLTCALKIDRFKTRRWKIAFSLSCLLICASTVFLKQHSLMDILIAVPVCYIADMLVYGEPAESKKKFRVQI